MIDSIISAVVGGLWPYLLAAGGVLAWFVDRMMQRRRGRSEGRREAATEAMKDVQERVERGRKAVSDGRSSGKSPDQRVRDNDQVW